MLGLAACALAACAGPARAQEIWSATLNPQGTNTGVGCESGITGSQNRHRRCDTASTLSDDGFTYDGTNYTVALIDSVSHGNGTGRFFFDLDKQLAAGADRKLLLKFGSFSRLFSTASGGDFGGNYSYEFGDPELFFTVGDSVTLRIEVASALVFSTSSVALDEGGTTSYDVSLQHEPSGTVTVAVASGDTGAATVAPATLSFTASDWSTAQTVTVTGVDDADGAHERVTITHGASGGGLVNESGTVTATVTDTGNSVPTAADGSVTTEEDTAHTFAAGEFNFVDTDAGDELESVKIETLPGSGTLAVDGTTVASGDLPKTVSKAELGADKLIYAPPANANGMGYASFRFRVNDGGADSASDYAMTVNVTAVNDAPTVANPIPDQWAPPVTAFSYQFPETAFSDVEGDMLNYAAVQDGGAALPAWLTFTSATRTFSGTPGAGDTGALSVKVTASDASESAEDTFTITVGEAPNSAPTAEDGSVTTEEDTAHTFSASEFNFADANPSDALASIKIDRLSGNLSGNAVGTLAVDGAAIVSGDLPKTVSRADLDAGKLIFTPPADANGTRYAWFWFRVNDGKADSGPVNIGLHNTMRIAVSAVNDAPTVANPIPDRSATASTAFSYQFPETAFSDVDGDALDYAAAQDGGAVLPAWLTFTVATRTFSGTPGSGDTGPLSVKVTASDASESAEDTFTITVGEASNSAPTAEDASVTTEEDTAHTFSASEFNFADADAGDALASIKIDRLSGNLSGNAVGTLAVDGTTIVANDLPKTVSRADLDAGKLIFTPPADANGTRYAWFWFRVNDGEADSASAYTGNHNTMRIAVSAVNDAPTAADGSVTTVKDTAYAFAAGDFNFADTDRGDALASVKIETLPGLGTLAVDGTTVVSGDVPKTVSKADLDADKLTYAPPADAIGEGYASFSFRVNDGEADSASAYTMSIDVTPNRAPTAEDASVTTEEDTAHTFSASEFNFADADPGDALASVKIETLPGSGAGALAVDGTAIVANDLPKTVTKAEIDRNNLAYTPPANANGMTYATFTFRVSDGDNDSAAAYTMTIDVTAANDAPTVANGIPDQAARPGTAFRYRLPANTFSDVDGDTLTYVAEQDDGNALPAWLGFDHEPLLLQFWGTPWARDAGTVSVKLTASDSGSSAEDTFDIVVSRSSTIATVSSRSEIWGATLNAVDLDSTEGGCRRGQSMQDSKRCDSAAVLTDDGFSYEGTSYTVASISSIDAGDSAHTRFEFVLDKRLANGADRELLLKVGSFSRLFSTADVRAFGSDFSYRWTGPGFTLIGGDSAELRIDAVPGLRFSAPAPVLDESGSARYKVGLTARPSGAVTVSVASGDIGAATVAPATLTFTTSTWKTAQAVTVTVNDNDTTAPTAGKATVVTNEDTAHAFAASEFRFADTDQGDELESVKIVTLPGLGTLAVDGTAIGSGERPKTVTRAQIDRRKLTYTPPADANGTGYASFEFKVNDGVADSAAAYTMSIDVTAVNDAPTVASSIPDNSATVGTAFSFQFPETAFADADGDPLTYAAALDDGAALPSWLGFAAGTRTFSGTPVAGDTGALSVKVTASDAGGGSAHDTFAITVGTVPNAAPTAGNGRVTTEEDTAHAFAASEFNFVDTDNDTLASVKIETLPGLGTLAVDGTTVVSGDLPKTVSKADLDAGELTYIPPANANGTGYASFEFKVNDGKADSASDYTMRIDVTEVNDAPTFEIRYSDNEFRGRHSYYASATAAGAFSYQLPADTVSDVDGDPLTYRATGTGSEGITELPDWIRFDADTRTFSGTLPGGLLALERRDFYVFVSDGRGGEVQFLFAIYPRTAPDDAPNAAPTASGNTVTTAEDTAHAFAASEFNFSDADNGDTLASVKIETLPGSGTLAVDGTAIVANDVPKTVTKAQIDQDKLAYAPPANANGSAIASFTFRVNDGDNDSAAAYTMTIDVTAANDAPTVANGIPDRPATAGTAFSYQVPADAFSDVDGDTLTYAAALNDGGTLPSWLTFTAGTRTFSGTPGPGDTGPLSVKVTASDDSESAEDTFTITVRAASNSAPTADDGSVTAAGGLGYTFSASEFNFADDDPGDTLSSVKIVTLPASGKGFLLLSSRAITSNTVIPAASIGAFVYTPPANASGAAFASFTFTVNDGRADSASAYTMTINVASASAVAPGAPTSLRATAGDGQATLNWMAPGNDGGAAITRYEYRYCTGASCTMADNWTDTGGAGTSHTVINLTNDTAYTLEVRAANIVGEGAASNQIGVTPVAPPSNAAPTAADNTVTIDEDITHTFAATEFNFSDTDNGDSLAGVKATTLETAGSLTLDSTDVTLNQVIAKADIDANKLEFTPAANASGDPYATFGFKVSDGDNDSAAAYTMTIDVTAVNDAPTVRNEIPDQTATEGTAFSYPFPANTFRDIDGDMLTYTAALDNGNALPSWLTFTPGTRTFSGTPGPGDAGALSVTVTASDDSESAEDTFTITVGERR